MDVAWTRWARGWPWLVLGSCALGSAVQLVRTGTRLIHFEPTSDALFTEYVYRPQARAAGWALAACVLATLLALVLRRRAGRLSPSALAVLCVPVVALLLLTGRHASAERRHPEGRMLAALRAVPTGATWQQASAPSLDPRDPPFPGELRAPTGQVVFRSPERDAATSCAELRALLLPLGWVESGHGCYFLDQDAPGHVGLSATVESGPKGTVITFRAGSRLSG